MMEHDFEFGLIGILLAGIFLCFAAVTCQGALVRMDVSDLWCDTAAVLIGDVLNIMAHRGSKGIIHKRVVVEMVRYNKNPSTCPVSMSTFWEG